MTQALKISSAYCAAQDAESRKTSQEAKLHQAERSLKSLQTTLAGLQGQLAAREQALQAYLKVLLYAACRMTVCPSVMPVLAHDNGSPGHTSP